MSKKIARIEAECEGKLIHESAHPGKHLQLAAFSTCMPGTAFYKTWKTIIAKDVFTGVLIFKVLVSKTWIDFDWILRPAVVSRKLVM